MEMKIELQPIRTPNYILSEAQVGKRQDGMKEGPKWPVGEISAAMLSNLCDQFRADLFTKAGKIDPRKAEE